MRLIAWALWRIYVKVVQCRRVCFGMPRAFKESVYLVMGFVSWLHVANGDNKHVARF